MTTLRIRDTVAEQKQTKSQPPVVYLSRSRLQFVFVQTKRKRDRTLHADMSKANSDPII